VKPGAARLHHKESAGRFIFPKNKVARGVVGLLKSLLLRYVHLHDVGLEENIPGPVYDHIEFAPEGGDFNQVDGSPEEPGDQTGKFQPVNSSHPVMVTDRSQKSLRTKAERPR
jgi:hypothetical protein